ncbi:MAG: hypothetical protein JWN52_1967 [Actinomycetia bacterium]|nr:hypothetical protein [Actinomycetes bacterium]
MAAIDLDGSWIPEMGANHVWPPGWRVEPDPDLFGACASSSQFLSPQAQETKTAGRCETGCLRAQVSPSWRRHDRGGFVGRCNPE